MPNNWGKFKNNKQGLHLLWNKCKKQCQIIGWETKPQNKLGNNLKEMKVRCPLLNFLQEELVWLVVLKCKIEIRTLSLDLQFRDKILKIVHESWCRIMFKPTNRGKLTTWPHRLTLESQIIRKWCLCRKLLRPPRHLQIWKAKPLKTLNLRCNLSVTNRALEI